MIITLEEFQQYTDRFTDSTTLQAIYIESAENIVESYLGFSLSTFALIPGIIKMTVLRIAALLQTEEGSNIGITSKSFDNGTRTFIRTTDYGPYLEQIASYRQV